MVRTSRAAVALTLVLLLAAHAQGQEPQPYRGRPEYRVLLRAEVFDGSRTGSDGEPSEPVLGLRLLLEHPEARAALLSLLDEASLAGQLYALCGLWLIDPPTFDQRVAPYLSDLRLVEFCPVGCSARRVPVADVVASSAPGAIRLTPAERSITDYWAWRATQPWREGIPPVADIVGGALPVDVGRHPGWGRLSERVREWPLRQRDLAYWVRELTSPRSERDAPDVDPVWRLSAFGYAALEACRELAHHRLGEVRRAVAELLGSALGVDSLGPRAGEAALILASLLSDDDASVRLSAAKGLICLGPWAAPALPAVWRALQELPASQAREQAYELVEVVVRADPAPAPRLIALLGDPSPLVREAVANAVDEDHWIDWTQARAPLRKLREQDPCADVRTTAARALEALARRASENEALAEPPR